MNPIRATLWSIGQRYIPTLIHIVATLIITRMITPGDFGEVALVTTFCQIASLAVASGFGEGLMYKVNNSQAMYSSVFFFNVGVALTLYVILFSLSGVIADFYEMPRLGVLVKVACLNIVVYSFSYIQKVQKQMAIDFKSLAVISLIASIIGSIIGISLAYGDFGVWSIVILTLSINVIEMLLLWFSSTWKPSFVFSWVELNTIIPYSSKILLNNFVQVFYDNIYSLVIGKFFNAKSLGYFNRMQTVVYYTTTNFVYSIESVFFPILCKKKDSQEDVTSSYERLMRLSTFIATPILIVLIALAKPIVVLVLTEKWIGGVEVLRLISIAYIFVPVIYINNSFLKIQNRTDVLFYSNIVKKVIGVVILSITIFHSFIAVCYGVIAHYAIDAAISMICTHRYLKISISKQGVILINNIVINAVLCIVLLFINSIETSNIIKCIYGTIFISAFYFITVKFLSTKESDISRQVINRLCNRGV